MVGSNHDTCRHGPPTIKLMGYEHWEDAVGGGGAGNGKHTQTYTQTHTHTHTVSPRYTRWMEPRTMIESNLDTCGRGPPTNLINGL